MSQSQKGQVAQNTKYKVLLTKVGLIEIHNTFRTHC